MKYVRMVAVGVVVSVVVMEILRPLWHWLGWEEGWLVVVAVMIATQAWPPLWERLSRLKR